MSTKVLLLWMIMDPMVQINNSLEKTSSETSALLEMRRSTGMLDLNSREFQKAVKHKHHKTENLTAVIAAVGSPGNQ